MPVVGDMYRLHRLPTWRGLPKPFVWSVRVMLQRARQVAYGCAACHGEAGLGVPPDFPHIAGQDLTPPVQAAERFPVEYPYQSGDERIAAGMTDQETVDIAADHAAEPGDPPESLGAEWVTVPVLVTRGNGSLMVPACQGAVMEIKMRGSPGHYGMAVLAGDKSSYLEGAFSYSATVADRMTSIPSCWRSENDYGTTRLLRWLTIMPLSICV